MTDGLDTKYIESLKTILDTGTTKSDRTGTGTISVFGLEIRHNLAEGFPLLTTKKVHFKSVVHELIWLLSGSTNISYLQKHKVKIWDGWADKNGEVGPMYGKQWRAWVDPHDRQAPIDQINDLITNLMDNPNSRRHLVTAWNVSDLPMEGYVPQDNVYFGRMALAACHFSFQCYVAEGKLSMIVNQRSADMFLGVPFNLASYALLTHMFAQICELEVGELIWRGGDCHIYLNHIDQVNEQISRHTRGEVFDLPSIELDKDIMDIDDFTYEDITLCNYQSGSSIKGDVSV